MKKRTWTSFSIFTSSNSIIPFLPSLNIIIIKLIRAIIIITLIVNYNKTYYLNREILLEIRIKVLVLSRSKRYPLLNHPIFLPRIASLRSTIRLFKLTSLTQAVNWHRVQLPHRHIKPSLLLLVMFPKTLSKICSISNNSNLLQFNLPLNLHCKLNMITCYISKSNNRSSNSNTIRHNRCLRLNKLNLLCISNINKCTLRLSNKSSSANHFILFHIKIWLMYLKCRCKSSPNLIKFSRDNNLPRVVMRWLIHLFTILISI
jgi:hypothetical protein